MNEQLLPFACRENDEYNLRIPAGKQVEIPAVNHFFDNVIIEEGAILTIAPNSENWVLIDCARDFVLNGKIVFRKFLAETTRRSIVVEGKEYPHSFALDRIGGRGGASGKQDLSAPHAGASGTNAYGGGGGAAPFWSRSGGRTPGQDGQGSRGGQTSFSEGGKGGVSDLYRCGGLLFINVGHDFILGPDNHVDLSAEHGQGGAPGSPGSGSITGRTNVFGSGGGGGAPGGDGGVLLHRVRGQYSGQMLQAVVNGGDGGRGGAGGLFPERRFPVSDGQPGEDGQRGRSGLVRAIREG